VTIRSQILLLCGCLLMAIGSVWCEQRGLMSASARHGKYFLDANGRRIYGKVTDYIDVPKSGGLQYVFFQDDDNGISHHVRLDQVKESPL
jgi:hypothetical protein